MELLVNIDVDDLERAVALYRDALGLRPGRRLFAGAVVEMVGDAFTLHLLHRPSGTPAWSQAPKARDYRRHWTPVHLDFVVDDLEAAVRSALAAGAVREGDIATFAWGRIATLSDPFGHGFCLVQFLGRGYEEVAA